MSSSISSSNLIVTGVVTGALLLAHQAVLSNVEAPLVAENNSQVVMLRAQQYEYGDSAPAVIVGSSISSRLPAGQFAVAGFPVANLGLDGLSPAFGLDLILDQESLPEVVLIEVNTLAKPVGPNAETIRGVRDGFGYEVARVVPSVRAENRPTTRLYNAVRSRRNSGFVAVPDAVPIIEAEFEPGAEPDARIEVQTVEASIRALQERNVEVILVLLPTGENEDAVRAVGEGVARRTGVVLIDMSGLEDNPDFFTDGIHLTPVAAAKVTNELGSYLVDRKSALP